MRVNTVEQFKILQVIKANFDMSYIKIELVADDEVRVTDETGDSMTFGYKNGKVVY